MSHWDIPLSDISFTQDEFEAVDRVLRSGWLTLGGEVLAFEQAFAEMLGTEDAVALSSGTAALHLALMSLGVSRGDEVIVPSLSFVATANAVVHAGGRPIFADAVGFDDLTLDPADVERKVTARTVGVVAMHYGGHACRMERLRDICRAGNLFLLEDAAHAPGGKWRGEAIGTLGDAGCFSFFGNKNLTTGEGGMVVARRREVLDQVRLLRSHGMTSLSWDRYKGHSHSYDVVSPGYNFRPTEFVGALGKEQLAQLPSNNERRNVLLDRYWQRLAGVDGVTVPFRGSRGTGHLCVVLVDKVSCRDALREELAKHRIQTSLHYPPIHLFQHFRQREKTVLPVTEEIAQRIITLPLFPALREEQVDTVCDVAQAFFEA